MLLGSRGGYSGIADHFLPPRRKILLTGVLLWMLLEKISLLTQRYSNLSQIGRVMNMLPNEIQILIYSVLLVTLLAKRGPVCGDPPFCGKKHGHSGPHQHEQSGQSGQSNSLIDHYNRAETFQPQTRLTGEIGALSRLIRTDGEMGILKLDAYLKNRSGHKLASARIQALDVERARVKLAEQMEAL